MIDLEILDNGVATLHRNVKKGEVIIYQNSYLKSINEVRQVNALIDLSKNSKLQAGDTVEGIPVIISDINTEDYLIVKLIEQ